MLQLCISSSSSRKPRRDFETSSLHEVDQHATVTIRAWQVIRDAAALQGMMQHQQQQQQ
jgi:hypothetical protein